MHGSDEQKGQSSVGPDPNPHTGSKALKALAADLPLKLDLYLRKIIYTAFKRCPSSGPDVNRMLKAFSNGSYSDADLAETLAALQPHDPPSMARAKVCAWMLGVSVMQPEDSNSAALALGELLLRGPKFALRADGAGLRSTFFRAGLSAGAAVVVLAAVSVLVVEYPVLFSLILGIGDFAVVVACLLVMLRLQYAGAARELRFVAAHALGRLGSVTAIGDLSAASLEPDSNLSAMALISMRVLLPRLTADSYGRLGSQTVPNICKLLARSVARARGRQENIHDLQLELLLALEQIGDSRAVGPIRQAANHWPQGHLSDAANRVLVVLRERQRLETEREVLLRAATDSYATGSADLLRAAIVQPELRPEQLLRPME